MVSYDLMKQQIERETSDYLAKNPIINISKPSISYKKKKVSIEFKFAELSKVDLINTIEVLAEYYETLSFSNFVNLQLGFYHLIAEPKTSIFDKKNEKDRLKIEFQIDQLSFGGINRSTVSFEKEKEFSQEDINSFLEVWKQYADSEVDQKKREEKDIRVDLRDLGALVYETNKDYTWDCIAGYERIKQEIKETIILPFENPEVYKSIGKLTRTNFSSNLPRAVLFEGPPGTAKTTMARVIANESGIPLIYVPIEAIMTCWYGESSKKLAKIFDYSCEFEKSLIFLDEIDSLAGSRDERMHEETRRILSVLLRKMQGFVSIENVLTIGATNRHKDLDSALLSRFNRTITFPLPNQHEREAIFCYYAKHLDPESIKKLSETTDSKSGRDIEDICSDAERRWAGKIISDNTEISPPSIDVYLKAIKFKFNGQ